MSENNEGVPTEALSREQHSFSEQGDPTYPEKNKQIDQSAREAFERSAAGVYLDHLGLKMEDLIGKKILDVGAGAANFQEEAEKLGIDVTSIDNYSWNFAEDAKVPIIRRDFRQGSGLPAQEYDLVVGRAAIEVMIHDLGELVQVFREAKRVLKHGGEFRFGPGILEIDRINTMKPVDKTRLKRYQKRLQKGETLSAQAQKDLSCLQIQSDIEKELAIKFPWKTQEDLDEYWLDEKYDKDVREANLAIMHRLMPDLQIEIRKAEKQNYEDDMSNSYYVIKKP